MGYRQQLSACRAIPKPGRTVVGAREHERAIGRECHVHHMAQVAAVVDGAFPGFHVPQYALPIRRAREDLAALGCERHGGDPDQVEVRRREPAGLLARNRVPQTRRPVPGTCQYVAAVG